MRYSWSFIIGTSINEILAILGFQVDSINPILGLLNDRFLSFSRRSKQARNDGMNPEIITLINSVMNSGFILTFRAHSDHRDMMKNPSLRVLPNILDHWEFFQLSRCFLYTFNLTLYYITK